MIPDLTRIALTNRVLLLVTGKLFRLAAQFAVLIIYSRKLSIQDYGTYQSVWLYINILSVAALFGLPKMLLSSSQLTISSWIKNNKRVFFLMLLVTNVVPILFFFFTATMFTGTTKLLLILLLTIQNVASLAEYKAIKEIREKRLFWSNIFFASAFLYCHFQMLSRGYSLNELLLMLAAVYTIHTLLLIFPLSRSIKTDVSHIIPNLGREWTYLGLTNVLGVVATWVDKWLILSFVSVTQLAIYFNGAYEIPVFGLMLSSVGNIMLVEYSRRDGAAFEKAKRLFEQSSLFLSSLMFPAFAFLLFHHHDFFLMVFTEKYSASVPIFFVTIFLIPVRITDSTIVLQTFHRADLIMKGSLYDLIIAIILMAVFYKALGMVGIALAFVISSYLQLAYYLWHTSQLLKKPVHFFFPFKKLGCFMLLSVLIALAGKYCFYSLPNTLALFAGAVVSVLSMIAITCYNYTNKTFKRV